MPQLIKIRNHTCTSRRLANADEANYHLAVSESRKEAKIYKQKDMITDVVNISTCISEHYVS